MEERNMVEEYAISGPEGGNLSAADAQGGAGGSVVYGADIVEEVREEERQKQDGETAGKTYNSAEFDAAVRRKIDFAVRDMKNRYENDPYYLMGKQMAEGGAAGVGMPPDAAEESMLRGRNLLPPAEQLVDKLPAPPAVQRELREKPAVTRIAKELVECKLNGELPNDMQVADIMRAYPTFMSDAVRHGVRAALRMANVSREKDARFQNAMQQAARNRTLPKAIKPGFNARNSGETDYSRMSAEEFKQVKERFQKAYLQGKKVKI